MFEAPRLKPSGDSFDLLGRFDVLNFEFIPRSILMCLFCFDGLAACALAARLASLNIMTQPW